MLPLIGNPELPSKCDPIICKPLVLSLTRALPSWLVVMSAITFKLGLPVPKSVVVDRSAECIHHGLDVDDLLERAHSKQGIFRIALGSLVQRKS